ncbi:GNAT family N-acetyltransferase [Clostridium sp. C2-6-12]|uniref:GNAT family N-acetyltransferase n=1 Tax=Clostridium sp. C2-6-12 TaxID=2698832 RepID=UPI00136AA420|nr:GNAT family N-acetyltransferase [Clostridium sp. C2-6-12]
MFIIKEVKNNKKEYLQFLILADPSEDMIDLYINKGEMYVLEEDNNIICEAVVVKVSDTECELKNIATSEEYQGKGYGKKFMNYLFNMYSRNYKVMSVGTTSSTAPFYNKLGFEYSHTVNNFFTDNYPEPIFEGEIQCVDMIYLKRKL